MHELARLRLGIKALGVAANTFRKGSVDVNLDELIRSLKLAYHASLGGNGEMNEHSTSGGVPPRPPSARPPERLQARRSRRRSPDCACIAHGREHQPRKKPVPLFQKSGV